MDVQGDRLTVDGLDEDLPWLRYHGNGLCGHRVAHEVVVALLYSSFPLGAAAAGGGELGSSELHDQSQKAKGAQDDLHSPSD